MKLYEIDSAISECFDEETGEVDAERLTELMQLRDDKIESLALYALQLKSDAETVDAEIDRLKKRKEAIEKKAKGIRAYLITALNGKNFKSPLVTVSKPRTSEKLVIDNPDAIPEGFFIVVETKKIDTGAIKQAVAGGWKTDAAHIEITQSVTIR